MQIFKRVSDFVFGMECLGCGSSSESLDPWLCPSCRAKLLQEAKFAAFPRDDVVCLFPMRGITRKLVHALKYKNLSGVASYLVNRSSLVNGGEASIALGVYQKPFYFVPVPLHPSRYRERGYNQAEKIAAALANATGGMVCRWLSRTSFRVSQTKLSKEMREWNVAGAFVPRFIRQKPKVGTVFVVDDVFTTGATTGACMAALEEAVGLNVRVCTLLYEEPVTAIMDFVADNQVEWDAEGRK
ncbi:MAG: ComF family protein [Fibrobacter sp.]|nr:ComF family protein [Fibrobacter sp.]